MILSLSCLVIIFVIAQHQLRWKIKEKFVERKEVPTTSYIGQQALILLSNPREHFILRSCIKE